MIIGITTLLLTGLIDGILEGYMFQNRKSFERKYNVDPLGFWGSLSYERKYTNPNIYNEIFGVFDFYHVADDIRKGGYLLSGILLVGAFNFADILVFIGAFALSAATKIIGLNWIRN